MAKKGFDGATVADIAKAAGLTPGLVHYHFESKQEILLSALATLVDAQAARLEAALDEAGEDPAAELVAFLEVHLGLGANADPKVLACWVLLSGEALRSEPVRSALEVALKTTTERLKVVLGRGTVAKQFDCADPKAAAAALVALTQGFFVMAATARSVIPPGSALRSALRMAEGLVRPKRPLS
jgi:TetR/AcrR family transcriptional repressor of bet genes